MFRKKKNHIFIFVGYQNDNDIDRTPPQKKNMQKYKDDSCGCYGWALERRLVRQEGGGGEE